MGITFSECYFDHFTTTNRETLYIYHPKKVKLPLEKLSDNFLTF